MLALFFLLFSLVSSTVAIAAQKPLAKQDQKILKEICPCQDCRPPWYWPFGRPHPLSQTEEEVAQVFAALPFADVYSGTNKNPIPLYNHILEYVEEDFKKWLRIEIHNDVKTLCLNGRAFGRNGNRAGGRYIFPKEISFFNDGAYRYYRGDERLGRSAIVIEQKIGHTMADILNDDTDVVAASFEKNSLCDKYRVAVCNFGDVDDRGIPLLTVYTCYRINHLARIMERVQQLNLQKAEKASKKQLRDRCWYGDNLYIP